MNFGGLGVCLLFGVLGLDFPPDDKFPNIVLLCQVEEFSNLASSLGSKSFGMSDISYTWDIGIALFHNHDGQDREIRTDDAAANRLAFTFSGTTGTVARMTFGQEEAHTCGMKDTLGISRHFKIIHSSSEILVCHSHR